MATDSTHLVSGNGGIETDSDMAGGGHEFGSVQLAAASPDAPVPVNIPRGQPVVVIPVRPGQTIELPTDSPDGLLAKLGADGNLAIVVDGRTIILQGYLAANEQAPIRIVTSDGDVVDIVEVLAGTLPDLDIQTAAGPAAAGAQGGTAGADAAGSGIFVPFAAGPLLGGINAEGVLGATKLQYKLIDDEPQEFPEEEGKDGLPPDIEIVPDKGQPVAEDGAFLLDEDFLKDGNQDLPSPSPQDDDGSAFASGTVVVDFGLDGPRAVDPIVMDPIVGGNGAPSGLLTTNGTPILLHLDAPAGGQQVLHGYLTNPGVDDAFILILDTATGHFEIFLNASLFHDENSFEDNVTLDIGFSAFDATNDQLSATLHLNFDDDMPEITAADASITLALDETVADKGAGDLDDPNFADGALDGSREEDDEHLETLPASLTGIGTVIGAATADASVLFDVDFGADNGALKDAEAYSLTILDADTGLFDTATGQAITLVDAGGGVIEGRIAGGVEVFALTVDPVTGEVSMAQYRAIDHGDEEMDPGAVDEVLFLGSGKLAVTLTATDGDGDQDSESVDIGNSISFDDDGPEFEYVDYGKNGDSGLFGKDIVGAIDEDMLPSGLADDALGDDVGGTVVDGVISFDFGSDIPGTLSIDGLTVTDSAGNDIALGDLQTSDGRDITIGKSVDPVTGIITWEAVVSDGQDGAGDPVFTFTLDGAGAGIGDFKFELHQALEHPFTDPDLQNDGPEKSYEDNLLFDFTVIGTDGDGDEATGHIKINVDDDSPTISHLDAAISLAVDETVAAKGTGDADDPDFIFPQDGAREEDDEHLETLPTALTNIGAVIGAATDDASKLFSVDFGADGGATTGDAVFDLKIVDTNTGLTDTQTGDPIVLVEGNGVILGVADDGDPNTDDPVVFALAIDPDTGALSMAQYRAVHHGDQEGEGGAFDEIVSLGAEKLAVTLTVTDADGDSVSAQRDIGNGISFDDDGPAFVNVEFGENGDSSGGIGVIDEDELPTGNKDSAAGDGPGGTIVDGVINFDFGSDVPGSLSLSLPGFTITDSAGNNVPLASLKTLGGDTLALISLTPPDANGVITLNAFDSSNNPVFTFTLDTSGDNVGAFTFELHQALGHPYTDDDFNNDGKDSNGDPQIAYEDNLVFDFTVVATDGDGDEAEGHIKIDVDDDSPVVTEAGGSFALAVDETLALKGTGDVDDPNYGGPTLDGTREEDDETLETLPVSLTGIGAVIGAATADASVLFDVDFGADGGAAAGDEAYSLTILDPNTGLTDTQTQEPITLHVNGSVIEGRNTSGDVVFALTVDPNTGLVSMAQYRAIDHGDGEGEGGAFDEVLSLGSGKLAVTLTATDGDGDKDSESVDIGGGITFDDDGPTFDETDFNQDEDGDSSGGIGLIDEDALSGGITGGPGDDAGGLKTDGVISFDFGSDKADSLSIQSLSITDSKGLAVDLNNLTTSDGRSIEISPISGPDVNGVITYAAVIAAGQTGEGDPVFTLKLDTEGGEIGEFEFELHQALAHPYTDSDFNNDGNPETEWEDNFLFDFAVVGTDGDGDEATGHIQISVDDDSPDVGRTTSGTINLTVDETVADKGTGDYDDPNFPNDGVQDGSRAEDDEHLETLPQSLKDIGTVIGAATAGASGLFTVNFGADGGDPADGQDFGFEILDATTNLKDTATGDVVTLFDVGGVIQGKNDDGNVVFALTIGNDGNIAMAQYRAVDHGGTEADPGAHDEVIALGSGFLAVTLTATDNDGDQDSDSVDIGSFIKFDDDGPTAATFAANTVDVVHDETAGIQNGGAGDLDGDDVAGTDIAFDGKMVASLFSSLLGGDDPDVGDYPIGYARSGSALVTPVGGSGGSDGIASTSHTLKVTDNTFSGVSTTEGTDIFLYQVSDTLIVGRVGTEGAPDTANPVGAIAFAIAIDPDTGEVFTAQYLSLKHPDFPDNHDEPVSLTDGAVQVTVTITDKDGDEASASDNVGSQIKFEDDGPTAGTVVDTDVLDDEGLAGGIKGGSGDAPGELISTTGTLTRDFGSDGPGEVSFANLDGKTTTLGTETIDLAWDDGLNTLTGSSARGDIFAIVVDPLTGAYTFNLLDTVLHSKIAGENDATLSLVYQVTDGDGDKALGTVSFTIDDDTPVDFDPEDTILQNVAGASMTGDLDITNHIGADDLAAINPAVFTGIVSGVTQATGIINGASVELTSGGEDIILYLSADGSQVFGKIDGGATTIFSATLDAAGSDYTFQLSGTIDNGAGIVFDDFTGTTAGNEKWFGVINPDINGAPADPTEEDLLLTPIGVDSINTNNTTIGVGNQSVTAGRGVRIDFVTNVTGDQDTAAGWSYDSLIEVNTGSFKIGQTSPNGAEVVVQVRAVSEVGTGTVFNDDTTRPLTAASITVMNGGVQIFPAPGSRVQVYTMLDGTVVVDGLLLNDEIIVDSATSYNRLEVTNADGVDVGVDTDPNKGGVQSEVDGKNFDLGAISILSFDAGSPIDLSLGVQITDGDGDAATGTIVVQLDPGGEAPVDKSGDANANTINGASGHDTLNGLAGADKINGDFGNDTLNGGDGDDTITGGGGNDVIDGGADNDAITAGDGDDSVKYDAADGSVDGGISADNNLEHLGNLGDVLDVSGVVAINLGTAGAGTKLVGFETVEMTGGAGTALTLSAADVIALGTGIFNPEDDLGAAGIKDAIKIVGDVSDSVILTGGGWFDVTSQVSDPPVGFKVYAHDSDGDGTLTAVNINAYVLVENDIANVTGVTP